MKIKNIISVLLCGAFVLALAAWCFFGPKADYSESERRALAKLPDTSWENISSGKFASGFEEYATDVFPMRDLWRSIKAHTRLGLFAQKDNNDLFLKDGQIGTLASVSTIADGIAVKQPGENTFRYVSDYVDEIALVTDDEVASAILALIEKQKMIAEGAGATAVAAVMANKFDLKGKRVVAVVSGGNIDVTSLSRVIDRGLLNSGRSSSLLIELIDKPGQLKEISRIIADCGGNVTGVHYEKGNTESVNGCFLRIEMETRDFEHVNLITKTLRDEGFKLV